MTGPQQANLDCGHFACTDVCCEPADSGPQQADASPLRDLVQQHASEWAKAALARRRNAHDEASAAIRRSQALLDRIAALVPQQPDLIAQVMAELDLTDPADVLITIAKRTAAFKRVCASADLRKERLDEARAEVERLNRVLRAVADPASASGTAPEQPSAPDFLASLNTLTIQRDEARAEALEHLTAIADLQANLDAEQPAQPDPLVLSLPEVSEDVRRTTNQRWIKVGVPGVWDSGWIEAPGLADGPLTIELAPRCEPRTAAEIWTNDPLIRHDVRMQHPLLAEALDREAGIS